MIRPLRILTVPCKVSGQLQDCCCQAETVDDINNTLYPLLQRLVKTTFFKYYKVCVHEHAVLVHCLSSAR